MSSHAFLSASSSHRWLNCPPSAKLNAEAGSTTSEYARQGTDCHELCAYLVEQALGRDVQDPTEHLDYYDAEMQNCAEEYRNFVLEQIERAKGFCGDPVVYIEHRLDFSRWVPDGFGTGDCVIVADEELQIIDYKHGVGVLVDAVDNSQMMCYALGALEAFDGIYDISRIQMTIFQPRRENVSTAVITKEDLLDWAENTLKPIAEIAIKGEGEFKAGDHCQFCAVKATCRKRAEYNLELAKYDFAMPDTLEESEIAAILEKIDTLTSWANDVKEYALKQAQSGVTYEGWKVVEGKSNRKFTDEDKVAKAVQKLGLEPYEKKLLGITDMTKLLGKARFEKVLGKLIIKPPGKPTLVPESDSRPPMNTATEDFNDADSDTDTNAEASETEPKDKPKSTKRSGKKKTIDNANTESEE